ncbi:tetratricopeptide repeat protein [Candidatus Fermentibacteria bacterium]|nr:tetratricopeptide repeat protein [Candidatus Fermentibacteria bacterium]
MRKDVFLSHSSSDRKTAERIRRYFESHGLTCWIAPRDIPPGADWVESIIDGIESCSAILLIVSRQSNNSPQVRRELEIAVSRGLTLVSVVIEKVELSKWMQYYISTRQWYDATSGELDVHLPEILEALSPGETEVFADLSNISSILERDIGRLASAIEYEKTSTGRLELGERRKATVLHVSIDNPSLLEHELSPTAETTISETLSNMVGKVTEAYGGSVEQHGRFDYRCFFGLEHALEDDSQRAVSSAIRLFNGLGELNRIVRKRGLLLEFCMGASSGALRVTRKKSGKLSALGNAIEEAEQLASSRSKNDLVVSEEIFRVCRHRFAFERIEPDSGKPYYRLDDYTVAPVEGRILQVRSPLVGRESELTQLSDILKRQHEGKKRNRRGGAIHLVQGIMGEAGLGKSRLVHEFRKTFCKGRDDTLVLEGHTLSYVQPPYWLWTDLLQRLLGIDEENKPDYGDFERLLGRLGDDEDLGQSAAFLAEALSIDSEDPRLRQLDGKAVALETRVAFSTLLQALARRNRLVVILEDLHRIDNTCREVLEFVIGNCDTSSPIVFLLVYRPEREDGRPVEFTIHPGYARVTELALFELSESSSEKLLGNLLISLGNSGDVSKRVAGLIMSCSRGNPLFLEEMVLDLVESETLRETDERWGFDRPVEDVLVPTTLTGLLQSRLDRLPVEWRSELQNLSVLGMEFSEGLCRRYHEKLHGRGPDEPIIEGLERKGFIVCSRSAFEKRYRFGNKLIHDVAYGSILPSNLELLHGAVARALEDFYSDDSGRSAGALTRHWEKAGDVAKTIEWGTRALDAAAESFQNEMALYLAARLEEWIESITDSKEKSASLAGVLLTKAKVQGLQGKTDRAERSLERALQIATEHELRELESLARIIYANSLLMKGHPQKARENLETALSISRERGDRSRESLALIGFGGLGLSEGKLDEALKVYSRAEEISREIGNRENEGGCLVNQGIAYHTRGMLDQALEHYLKAQRIFDETGNRKSSASNLVNVGILHFNQDRMEEAKECYGKALGLLRRIGFRRGEGHALVNLGIVHRCEGRLRESMSCFVQAMQIHREIANRGSEVLNLINMSELYLKMEDPDQALAKCSLALDISREIHSRRLEGHTLSQLGDVYRILGRLQEAFEALEESLQILRELDEKKQEGAALRRLGLLHCERGSTDEAFECYAESVGIIENLKGGVFDSEELLELRRRLVEMGVSETDLPLPKHWDLPADKAGPVHD